MISLNKTLVSLACLATNQMRAGKNVRNVQMAFILLMQVVNVCNALLTHIHLKISLVVHLRCI